MKDWTRQELTKGIKLAYVRANERCEAEYKYGAKHAPSDHHWYPLKAGLMPPVTEDGRDRTGEVWQWVSNDAGELLYRKVADNAVEVTEDKNGLTIELKPGEAK